MTPLVTKAINLAATAHAGGFWRPRGSAGESRDGERAHGGRKGDVWQSRKNAYLAHLEEADPDALIVSLADKTHNLAAILEDFRQKGDSFWDIFNAGVERQVWYYGAVADVLNRRMEETALLRRYNQLVEELRQATTS